VAVRSRFPEELVVPLDEGEPVRAVDEIQLGQHEIGSLVEQAGRLRRGHLPACRLHQGGPEPGGGHPLVPVSGDPAARVFRQLDHQRHFEELPAEVAAVQDLPLLAELLAVGRGHDQERPVPLAARPQLVQQAPQAVVGPGHVQAVQGLESPLEIGRQGDGGIEERRELVRQDAGWQAFRLARSEPRKELRPPEVGRLRLGEVDPHELPPGDRLELAGRLGALAKIGQEISPLVVPRVLRVHGLARETGGLPSRGLEGLGQGDERGSEAVLHAENLVLPGAQAREQGRHGRRAPARRRDRPARPVRLADQGVEVGGQPRLASQTTDGVGAQGVEGDEDDGAVLGRRRRWTATGQKKAEDEGEFSQPGRG